MRHTTIKASSISTTENRVSAQIARAAHPSASKSYQDYASYDALYRFSRSNPTYTGRAKAAKVSLRKPAKPAQVLFAIALVLIAIGACSAVSGISILGDHLGLRMFQNLSTSNSTPVVEWRRGEVPYLYQTDTAWADTPYAGATIKTHGCGPTALNMVYIALTGKTSLNPEKIAAYAQENGYVDSGATSWVFMSEGAHGLGINSRELSADESAIKAQLNMGHPIICIVGPGDFTTDGHFIVLTKVADDGTIEIRDPNSVERSHKTWDAKRILSQCRNLWVYSS